MIKLTGMIDVILARKQRADHLSDSISNIDERKNMPPVIIESCGNGRISLRFKNADKNAKVVLTQIQTKFILHLKLENGVGRFEDIWKILYGTPYESDKSEPLRTHKKDIVKKLKLALGDAPNKRPWIGSEKHTGYLLNRSVKWQFAKDAKLKMQEQLLGSRVI